MLQALPLVTVIVGKKVDGEETTIYTTTGSTHEEQKTTFEMPNKNALIRAFNPGGPKWVMYIKGNKCVLYFNTFDCFL